MSRPVPAIPSTATDLELLRAFEPAVRFTHGEQFFPSDVERFVHECSLWAHYPDGRDEQLVPQGALTLEGLTEPRAAPFGSVLYLRLVEPLDLSSSAEALNKQAALRREKGNIFHAGQGRLARGGLLPRLADALFSGTLLLRGRVPGATAAVAELTYDRVQTADEKYVYHGRVVRESGWVVLQYWFFYFFNSWRSGFHGVNDHESDWEMIVVYLYPEDGVLKPEWVAYASHDFHGADLRRRWDDEHDLEIIDGQHPVVYAGAGSHASYFLPGEYQAEVSPPLPKRVAAVQKAIGNIWARLLGGRSDEAKNPFRIPFVDFARGDGLSVGPGQAKTWSPNVLDDKTLWSNKYRGLWGLFARDPISGENAPAGPMYNRDGSPRASWYDVLGFAALEHTPPPTQTVSLLEQRIAELDTRRAEIEKDLPTQASELQEMGSELDALKDNPHLAKQAEMYLAKVNEQAVKVRELKREQAENLALKESLEWRLERLNAGQREGAQSHIKNLAAPVSLSRMRFNRLTEAWAAVSLSLLLLAIVLIAVFDPGSLVFGVAVMVIVFVLLESILRGTYIQTISTISLLLAVITGVILVYLFWLQILVVGLVIGAIFLLLSKVRELRSA